MELGDRIVVNERRHPFYNFTGTVVGKRGYTETGDLLLLILINERQRSFLIPESMVCLQNDNPSPSKLS
jgi:hypothetical protein